MKRKLTLFLSAVMATSCLPMTAYAANFKDINDVPWASGVINSVADKGLLSGYEDGTFRGKNNVTYCEAMQMVYTTMVKSGAASSMDAVSVYGYMQSLTALNVPKWAQMAVAYGLSEGILDMQTVATKFAGGNKTATREDVAVIFGNAMGRVFGKERDVTDAKKFADYWSISANAMEQVSMLKKMGIIKGDDYNRFNPKKNISRAEMAVMLNNTYGVLAEGVSVSGEIVELDRNTGADGTNYYYIAIETEEGFKEGFSVTDGKIPVYKGDTKETMSMSKLSEGDDVVFVFSGTELLAIRQMEGITNQEKYDITGYVNSIKDNTLSLENENTGETTKYKLDSGTDCYIDGKEVRRSDLDDIMKERYKDYAYAGLNTEVKREKNKTTGNYENVTYVKELYITFVEEYSVIGQVTRLTETNISVKLADSSAEKTFLYADGCKYYIGDEAASYAEAKKMVSDGTTYVKLTADKTDKATSVILSEDTFADAKELEESKKYKLSSLSNRKLVLEDKGEDITYEFGSKNPLENIQFYTWDDSEDEWDDKNNLAAAESVVDAWEDAGKTVYVKVTFNSGDKLSEVYFSDDSAAWKNSTEHQTERKGTVASLENDILKFKTSSVEYKMLKSYESGKLNNASAVTESKTVLARMANDDALELYAEITANGDNEVLEISARLKAAEGKLVEFNPDERYIEIETDDNNSIKIKTQKSPELTDEVENEFELSDLEGKYSRYVGETVTLGFTSNGVVNEITVGGGSKYVDPTDKVKGIAVAADDGLKLEGDSTTYRWKGRTSEITVRNYSGETESLSTIKKMIEDPDVEVYVEASLEESAKGDMVVDSIKVYVKAAEGTLKEFDGDVRITTDAGNTFTFYAKNKLDTCDVNGYGQEDVEERDKGIGAYVALTFDKYGDVSGIESK